MTRPPLLPDPAPAAPPGLAGADFSVVVPFFNEAESAPQLLAELRAVTATMSGTCEVILIDDGSSDATAAVLRAVAGDWPQCTVFRFEQNHGQAAALYFGIHRTTAPVIVTLDGDGQNDPADIPALIARLHDAGMVCGVRASRQDSWLRRRMSRVANAVRSRILRDGVTDSGCAIKAFRREIIPALIPIRTLYSFIPAFAAAAGFRVVEEPVNHRPRLKGVSKYGLGVMLWRPLLDMAGVWWFISRRCTVLTNQAVHS